MYLFIFFLKKLNEWPKTFVFIRNLLKEIPDLGKVEIS